LSGGRGNRIGERKKGHPDSTGRGPETIPKRENIVKCLGGGKKKVFERGRHISRRRTGTDKDRKGSNGVTVTKPFQT